MYKVFKETLLTDMGRNKVRMHHRTTDAQAVWKEYSEYMTTASWQVMVVNPNPQNNCEDQDPTGTPSTVPTTFQVPVITPSILSVHITHWQPSAINLSTLTLITTLHYPNLWQNTTMKTWIPLILQVQYQRLFKLPVITPPILSVLMTQWQPSAINHSTSP